AEAVADLPMSVVRQLAIGDEVDLAGRRLRILDVQDDERKVVRATPVQVETAKELLWLGSGAPVSWEVAQSVQSCLNSADMVHAAWSGARRPSWPTRASLSRWPYARGRIPRSWSKKNCAWA